MDPFPVETYLLFTLGFGSFERIGDAETAPAEGVSVSHNSGSFVPPSPSEPGAA